VAARRRESVRAPLLLLAGVLACSNASSGPTPSTPRIDYVDGAIEPFLVPGQSAAIEGFGFGDTQGNGTVTFPRLGGGTVTAPVAGVAWSNLLITISVPDSAASGELTVTTTTGGSLSATVHILPRVAFDPATLTWQPRTAFPRSPVGIGLTSGTEPAAGGAGVRVTLYAAGGAEPLAGDSVLVPDSAVFIARTAPGGQIGPWSRPASLPVALSFAAVAFANRYNSRLNAHAMYVIGGIDSSGRARAAVYQSIATNDTALGAFTPIEPLPAPIAGAIAVVRRGRIYLVGGADSLGRPQTHVYVGRIGANGHIDGWYLQPALPAPRAYGGGVALDHRVVVFGGIADSAPPGGGLVDTLPRLAAADTAALSLASGFFVGNWASAGTLLPVARSQFATLILGNTVLLVGGIYAGALASPSETLAASIGASDSLGGFAGPTGTNTIVGLGGGTLVGPAGATWRDADGSHHGLVTGGIDLATRERRDGSWGF
jgi:hypothetical protein